jgi:eukaryotic-like serine/threonine-protein kinase
VDSLESSCPSDQLLARYGDKRLHAEERIKIEAHLQQCEACDLAAAMLRGSHASSMHFASTMPRDLLQFEARTRLARTLAPGATLGRFRLERRLGIGAMGVVFEAYDGELDRRVAIKVLLESGDSPERERDRLAREARSMARLSHPNVVTVFEFGMSDARVFLAMELVVGCTLQEWLLGTTHRPPPSQVAVLTMFQQIAKAVEAGHRVGIVHRDLKPQNILVTEEGQAKVTDFGLAEATSLSVAGGLVGTPAYMSLEALRGAPAAPAADQFALAVCLHEALCGKRPYEATTLIGLRAVLAERPKVDRTIDARIRPVLERALDPSPALRYGSVAEFGAALQHTPARSPRVGLVAAAAVVFLGIGGVAAARGLSSVRSSPIPSAFEPGPRSAPTPELGGTASSPTATGSDPGPSAAASLPAVVPLKVPTLGTRPKALPTSAPTVAAAVPTAKEPAADDPEAWRRMRR